MTKQIDQATLERVGLTDAREISRYQEGWRSGKPVEDPEKLKRWGYIGAEPSE
jgi:flotillin